MNSILLGLVALDPFALWRPPQPVFPPVKEGFPEGRVGYAVGDIHGRGDLLAQMLALIEADAARSQAEPMVVFLGDYVDRGPDSRGVLDQLIGWSPGFERRLLMGNHEQALLRFLRTPERGAGWLDHGGMDTLASFEVKPPKLNPEDLARAAAELHMALGPERIQFLNSLERYVICGGYFFTHAGVDPEKAPDNQSDADLFWARSRFVNSKRPWSHIVVHGHTPVEAPYRDERRIAVDTGAYATGRLSAARLAGEECAFLEVSKAGTAASRG